MSCELPEFCDESEHTYKGRSKEPFKCCECRALIPVGHRYVQYKGVWNGDFEVFRFHKLCHTIMRERDSYLHTVARLYEDEMPGFGQLIQSTLDDTFENGGERSVWWPKDLPMTRQALAEAATKTTEAK